jgi:hypothetical protein
MTIYLIPAMIPASDLAAEGHEANSSTFLGLGLIATVVLVLWLVRSRA